MLKFVRGQRVVFYTLRILYLHNSNPVVNNDCILKINIYCDLILCLNFVHTILLCFGQHVKTFIKHCAKPVRQIKLSPT